jgi:hypothetical protein
VPKLVRVSGIGAITLDLRKVCGLQLRLPTSLMQLLGLAELADGSLFFSFGGSLPPLRNSNKSSVQPRAKHHESKMEMGSHNLKPADIPHRFPSSFHKMSPITAVRKKANSSKGVETGFQPQPQVADNKKVQTTKKDKEWKPARLPSAFSKRSPIVKNRKVVTPTKEDGADEDYTSEEEVGTPDLIKPATATRTVYDPEKDAPFSPTLREILGHGKKNDNTKDEVKPTTSQRKSTSSKTAPGKKKSSAKAPPLETPKTAEIPIDNGSVSKDLDSHKLPELRNLAKARGLKGYSKLKKSELVDLLKSSES